MPRQLCILKAAFRIGHRIMESMIEKSEEVRVATDFRIHSAIPLSFPEEQPLKKKS
tara:strand:- start:1397 stop:1564 length:168 start_codon:yes stop_codon:yes gene_type:complete